jgi:four helix bundle protein
MAGSYKDLRVWQDAMELAVAVCDTTVSFPRHELYALSSQLRRAAVSVPSNIAEGKGHRSDLEFKHFLYHARGSLLEAETQVHLAMRLKYISEQQAAVLFRQTESVARSLNALINSLGNPRAGRGQRLTTSD